MTILDRILAELGESKGPNRSSELAANVGVSESALEGMVTVLVERADWPAAIVRPSKIWPPARGSRAVCRASGLTSVLSLLTCLRPIRW